VSTTTAELLERRRDQLFPQLQPAQIARLEPHASRRDTRAGEVLLDIGVTPTQIFVVLSGSIDVLEPDGAVGSTNGFSRLTTLNPGEFSGEMSALRGTRGLARLQVRDAGAVLALDLEQVQRIVQNDSELSELFMRAFILRRLGMLLSGHGEITVLGSSSNGETLRIREFLTRNSRPYVNVDLDHDPESQGLLERLKIRPEEIPVVICRTGRVLRNPGNAQLAERLGLNSATRADEIYDVLIIGAGPAGLAAAVYAASEGLRVHVVDSFAPGGQAGTSSRIENYLGFPTGISGAALAARALSQAVKFGAQLSVAWQAVRLHCDNWPFEVHFASGQRLRGRSIVIASGVQYRTLELPNLERFLGNGVYFAATNLEARLCDGADVAVIGGGNSAGQAAVFLASSCRHVHVLVRAEGLAESMSSYLIRRIEDCPNITLHTRTRVVGLEGTARLERLDLSVADGAPQPTPLQHLFLMTGATPHTGWLRGCVALDDHDFVKTGTELLREDLSGWSVQRAPYLLETNIPGVFAVGDVRAGSVKRIASGVGEGSICIQFLHRVLQEFREAAERPRAAVAS
jgi:thioredoxin reductase (NADPH)